VTVQALLEGKGDDQKEKYRKGPEAWNSKRGNKNTLHKEHGGVLGVQGEIISFP